MAKEFGGISPFYEDEEIATLKEQVETIREDQYLEDVYGSVSKLDNDPWLAKNSKEAAWVFNTVQLRKRLFESASIEMKHFNAQVE